ncbi:MAG: hypothetical protein OQK82_07265 [Candidatus Pacearchaeota archaeon]|nr:hypothetical protein [Candidatus Pacearchaeota archaeon]
MAKKKVKSTMLNLVAWITGIIVSLAVGFSMIGDGALNQSIPYLSKIAEGLIVSIAGWVVVITTLISVVLAILEK